MSVEIVVALIGGAVTLIVALLGTLRWIASRAHDATARAEQHAMTALQELLGHKDHKTRSFQEISKRIGGFEPDELRRLLLAVGAVRFERHSDGAEMWGFLSETRSFLDPSRPDEAEREDLVVSKPMKGPINY